MALAAHHLQGEGVSKGVGRVPKRGAEEAVGHANEDPQEARPRRRVEDEQALKASD